MNGDRGILWSLGSTSTGLHLAVKLELLVFNTLFLIDYCEAFHDIYALNTSMQASELRAGRLKKAGKVKVPSALFSYGAIKTAYECFTNFGGAKCFRENQAYAGMRQMTSQQLKRWT